MTDAGYHDRALDFGDALFELRAGRKVARRGWSAGGQFVVYQKGYPDGIEANANTAEALGIEQGATVRIRPYLMLRAADGSFVPWAPTVTDVLAEDWTVTA